MIAGDTVNYVGGTATFADKNVGTGKTVTGTGLGLAGADAGQLHGQHDRHDHRRHHAATLTGSITAANKVYDGNTSATITSRTLTGVIGGDTVSYVGGTATFADKNVGTGKTVTGTGLGLAGADAGNYTVNTTATTTADITAAALTGSITAANKVYDGNTAATITSRTLTGVIGGDTVELRRRHGHLRRQERGHGQDGDRDGPGPRGRRRRQLHGQHDRHDHRRHHPAPLTIAADNKTRIYGDPNPPLTATFTGLVGGQTPAVIPGVAVTTPATIASNAATTRSTRRAARTRTTRSPT